MKHKTTITILVENTSNQQNLLAEHGWAVWLEHGRHRILFDTGQSGIIQSNAAVLGIDLKQANEIVLSHGHNDHTGGLMRVLDIAAKTNLYLHPDAMVSRYSCHAGKEPRNISMPTFTKINLQKHRNVRNLFWTQTATEVVPGITVTGTIKRNTEFEDTGGPFFLDPDSNQPDPILDDQALFIDSPKGLVVILGCAHAGVINTLEHISQITGKGEFYAVIGGMHLCHASTERIQKTIKALKNYNVQRIGVAHCTGTNAATQLYEAFPRQSYSCSVGTTIEF